MSIETPFVIIGSIVALLGLFNLSRVFLCRRWPTTIARIDRNEVRNITSSQFALLRLDPISQYSTSRYGTDKEMVLALSYVYAIDGSKYIGDQLYAAPIFKSRSQLAGVNEGDKVHVFYNPKNPRVSFLAQSFAWPSLVVVAIGAGIIFAPLYTSLMR